jgi:hypothetical protein
MQITSSTTPLYNNATATPPQQPAQKVIVVVHGVGDQSGNTTVQTVVNRVCAFYSEPGSIPLGQFPQTDVFRVPEPWPHELQQTYAFREVYWADVPRSLGDSNYRLEPPTKWGKSIVERLRLRAKHLGLKGVKDDHFHLTEDVLRELIQALDIANRLAWLAERAGVATVDLPKLLNDYLGDVQVVAEYPGERDEILGRFDKAMERATANNPKAEVYVVAHSEGTVVTMLALLRAFREGKPWASQVRGLMTIGSPLDKHLVLWPELFKGQGPSSSIDPKITWRNYYDLGDPIGFELDTTRKWINTNGWSQVFDFQDQGHDFGFSRYPLPGKAHVDYWSDADVFGHFLSTVVLKREGKDAHPAPATKWLVPFLSYTVPYILIFALFCVAGFLLFKTVTAAIAPAYESAQRVKNVVWGAAGLGSLLMGITVASRLPRLTRSPLWWTFAIALGVGFAAFYRFTISKLDLPTYVRTDDPLRGVLGLAIGIVAVTFLTSVIWPRSGIRPLLGLGAGGIAFGVVSHLREASLKIDLGPLWPVVLGGIGAIYLWWLGALMFDLVFVWHLYIRHGRMMSKLDALRLPMGI